MKCVFSSNEAIQRPRSTATGEELNISAFQRCHRAKFSTFPSFFFSKLCLCFPGRRDEEEKQPENSRKSNLLPGDFKYPESYSKGSKIIEENLLIDQIYEEKRPVLRKNRIINLGDFKNKYPQNSLFFLKDSEKKTMVLAKIIEIEREDKKSRVSSKVTKSMSHEIEKNEDFSPEIKEIRVSPLAKSLVYLFKRLKSGFFLMITGKEPESFALKSLMKNEQFLMILNKGGEKSLRKHDFRCLEAEIISSNLENSRKSLRGSFDATIIDFLSISRLKDFFLDINKNKEELYLEIGNQIEEAFAYSENLVLILPGMQDIGWLLGLFVEKKEAFSLEIEIFPGFSNNLELMLIYYGKFNRINKQEALDYMSVFLNRDCSFHKNKENINHFLGHLIGKLGFRSVFQYILHAEEMKDYKNATLFQRFLDLIREKDRISLEEQQEFLSHDKKPDKTSSFFENCSAFSFQKKRRKSELFQYFSKEKTPDFEFIHKKDFFKSKLGVKDSKISHVSEKDIMSYSEYWLENPDLRSSTDSNRIIKESERKKGLVREKSV